MRRHPAFVIGALAVLASVTALALAGCTSLIPFAQSASKPNFVFVLTDDLSMNLVSHMPHVVGLQKTGMTMSNYYVTDSLCCPSRSAIFTGEFAHDNGVFTNNGDDGGYNAYVANGDESKSFAVALQNSGYRTGFMGKYLNGYEVGNPGAPGWSEWDVAGSNGYAEYNYNLNENGTIRHYGNRPEDYMVDVLSRKGADFIGDAADAEKPFMLEVATFAPHGPYTPPARYIGTAKGIPYPKTAAYDTLPTDAPAWLADRPALNAAGTKTIDTAWEKRVEAVHGVDDMIGNLQRELTAKGVADDTYIVFSSDNGYHMGEYRLLPGKQTAFDTDIHVPLVVSGPGVPAGKTTDALAANVDLCPTFQTLAGASVGSDVDGVSLANLWHGAPTPSTWQRALLVEHHGPNDRRGDPDRQNAAKANPPSYAAVRTAHSLYVKYDNGDTEYYDTDTDPSELHNVAAKGIPSALKTGLTDLQQCHGAKECQAAARLTG